MNFYLNLYVDYFGNDWGQGERMRWLYGITNSMKMSFSKLQEIVKDRKDWCAVDHGVFAKSWTWLGNWTTTKYVDICNHNILSWGRKWQPTLVFLPGEFHEQRSLVDYSPWSRKESDTTEWLRNILSILFLQNLNFIPALIKAVHENISIGLTKEFVWSFPQDITEKPKQIFLSQPDISKCGAQTLYAFCEIILFVTHFLKIYFQYKKNKRKQTFHFKIQIFILCSAREALNL